MQTIKFQKFDRAELAATVQRVERRQADRRASAQREAEAELAKAFDAFYEAHPFFTEPQPVPEVEPLRLEGAHWVGVANDCWGTGR